MNKVTVRGVDGSHRDYGLNAGTSLIGRDPASDIHLKDSQVSWKHAVLIIDAGGCVIEDLTSANGTFVGSTRIQRHLLHPGDRIKIGPYELMLQAVQEEGRHPIEVVARETGFASRERMRRAFLRAYGQPPQAVRRQMSVAA